MMMNQGRSLQRVLLIVFVLTLPVQSFARRQHTGNSVHVDIITDQRGLLQQFDAGSQRMETERNYIIARHDERYRIRISNPSDKRVGVVIAVDGRNIISGKRSHLSHHERMYIINPYQTQEFDGWRTGRNRINRFYFTGMNDSYGANWGDQTAMGVVAIAVFNERHRKIHRKKRDRVHPSGRGRNARSSNRHSQWEAPGTGFGEGEWSPSEEVHFVAKKHAAKKMFIKYEWRKTLCRMGIIQCKPRRSQHAQRHNRFWPHDRTHSRDGGGFVPFPSWLIPPGF